eukprot:7189020-Karenia_brevis.AAC.1
MEEVEDIRRSEDGCRSHEGAGFCPAGMVRWAQEFSTQDDTPVRPNLNPIEDNADVEIENGGVGEVEGEDEEEAKTFRVPDVKKPSRDEVAQHNDTHAHYRSWCKHCVRGRGVATPH